MIDLYEDDTVTVSDLPKIFAAGYPWSGVWVKVSQGDYYDSGEWLETMYPAIKAIGADHNWFRTGYHGLDIGIDGKTQAEYFLRRFAQVGGGSGDLPVVVDIETGMNESDPDETFTRAQIADCAAAFALTVETSLGRRPICYAGSYLRDNALTVGQCGCDYGWVADYGPMLLPSVYESIGLDLETLFGWQYCGDNGNGTVDCELAKYPCITPVKKLADLSAIVICSGPFDMRKYLL
jgi:hypothetical protein